VKRERKQAAVIAQSLRGLTFAKSAMLDLKVS
jgi:hypothetical protein